MTMPYAEDQSMQRFGRNLPAAEQAAEEVREAYAKAEALKDNYTQTFGKMTDQAENDLPASKTLTADMQALRTRAAAATTADDWRSIAADAAALHGTYQREHETDEDRMSAPRNSRAAEKRADVTTAEQDT